MNDQEKLQKAIEILKNVKVMRGLQKEYFKNRLAGDLQRSKQYERLVDKEIDDLLAVVYKIPVRQPDLFNAPADKTSNAIQVLCPVHLTPLGYKGECVRCGKNYRV